MLKCRQTLRTSELSSDGVLSNDELQAVIAIPRGLRLPLYASISEPAGASIAGGTQRLAGGPLPSPPQHDPLFSELVVVDLGEADRDIPVQGSEKGNPPSRHGLVEGEASHHIEQF